MVHMNLTFILDPLETVFSNILTYVPGVLGVLAVLLLGGIVARAGGDFISSLLKRIHIDKVSHKIGLDHILTTGGIKRHMSDLIGFVFTWGITITVLVIALSYAGITIIGPATDPIMTYVPKAIEGVLTLMVGMLFAHIVSVFVLLVAANTNMPMPDKLATFTKWAIVLMAVGVFVEKVGLGYMLTGTPLNLMIASLALALGLAFGLGGREYAAHYLEKLLKK